MRTTQVPVIWVDTPASFLHAVGVPSAPRAPDTPVPDEIHDPESLRHRCLVAVTIFCQQPTQHVFDDLSIRLESCVHAPVPGTTLFVLALAADVAGATDPSKSCSRIAGHDDAAEREHARLRLRRAVLLTLVTDLIDGRPEARRGRDARVHRNHHG